MTRKSSTPKKKMKRATPLPTCIRKKTGPRGAYRSWMADEAKELIGKLGARNKDLAEYFEVSDATIDNWLQKIPEFAHAVKFGRMESALKVSQSLYNRARGYSHPDVHILTNRIKIFDEEGNVIEERTEPLLIPITKHYPPDTAAAVKFLSVRGKPYGWAEGVNVNHTVSGEITHRKVEEMSMDELTEEAKALVYEVTLKQLSDAQNN